MTIDESTTAAPAGDPAANDTAVIDTDKLMAFVFRAVDEVGAALNAALVVMGDQLGYYRALAEQGPLTAADLSRVTATGDKYAREWLNAQAAGGYLTYEPTTQTYAICPEYAIALTQEDSPAFLPGLFQIAHGTIADCRVIEVLGDHSLCAAEDHHSRPEAAA